LHRLELAVGRQVPRIGLSATLGDLTLAAEYLRPLQSGSVQIIDSGSGGQELKLLIRGYEETREELLETNIDEHGDAIATTQRRIADNLFNMLRGTNNLVFANSRADVESYADVLRS